MSNISKNFKGKSATVNSVNCVCVRGENFTGIATVIKGEELSEQSTEKDFRCQK